MYRSGSKGELTGQRVNEKNYGRVIEELDEQNFSNGIYGIFAPHRPKMSRESIARMREISEEQKIGALPEFGDQSGMGPPIRSAPDAPREESFYNYAADLEQQRIRRGEPAVGRQSQRSPVDFMDIDVTE